MNLDDLTIGQAKEFSRMFGNTLVHNPYKIGKNYFIRTVTMIQIGKLVEVGPQELVLENACWVADTGRFTQALSEAVLSEVEMFPKGHVIVGRATVIDACIWPHDLPQEQK